MSSAFAQQSASHLPFSLHWNRLFEVSFEHSSVMKSLFVLWFGVLCLISSHKGCALLQSTVPSLLIVEEGSVERGAVPLRPHAFGEVPSPCGAWLGGTGASVGMPVLVLSFSSASPVSSVSL